jgi:hypothetical protein
MPGRRAGRFSFRTAQAGLNPAEGRAAPCPAGVG